MQLQAPEHLSVTCYPWPIQCLHLHHAASTGRTAGVRTDINMVWGAFLMLWNIFISAPALWENKRSMVSASDLCFEVMLLMTFLALALLQSPARSTAPSAAPAHFFFLFLFCLGSSIKYLAHEMKCGGEGPPNGPLPTKPNYLADFSSDQLTG